jgi:hypothetical protein
MLATPRTLLVLSILLPAATFDAEWAGYFPSERVLRKTGPSELTLTWEPPAHGKPGSYKVRCDFGEPLWLDDNTLLDHSVCMLTACAVGSVAGVFVYGSMALAVSTF